MNAKPPAGDAVRQAISDQVKDLKVEARQLNEASVTDSYSRKMP